MSHREPRATIDYETRSAADIRNGAYLYAKHPSTRILCLSFKLPGDRKVSGWHAAYTDDDTGIFYPAEEYGPHTLRDLFDHIEAGGLVEAHNSFFERCVSFHIASRPYGLDENGATGLGMPPIKDTQWRCSAAKCAAFALPRALGEAGKALRLPIQKDDEGRKIMLRLSKPRRPRKGEDPKGVYYINDHVSFRRLYSYCDTDVDSEEAVSECIPDLSPFEYKVWLADQRANWRGVRVDMDLVYAAMRLDTAIKHRMNKRLLELTGVERGTMRSQLLAWLNGQGVNLLDTAAPTLDWFMLRPEYQALPHSVQEVIRIMRNINRTSIRKFHRILDCVDMDDGRVRELVMYHGAATGRWSGKGIQVQNFPRGMLEGPTGNAPWDITIEEAVALVKEGDLEWLTAMFGDDILNLISSVCRAAIIPTEGYVIVVADYSAIEARVVLWLAQAQTALEVFLRGEDIYCDMASGIYGRTITKKDKAERQFGKVTILGLGYGMGFLTFLLTLRGYDLHFTEAEAQAIVGDKWDKYSTWVRKRLFPDPKDYPQTADGLKRFKAARRQAAKDQRKLTDSREDPKLVLHELVLCKFVVDAYRARYPEVVELWKLQEDAAIEAVSQWKALKDEHENSTWTPFTGDGPEIVCGLVSWQVCGRFLFCKLPSGRRLVYTDPEVNHTPTPWGGKRSELRFWGVHKKTKKWSRMGTYGGSIVENIDQGTARDMMAYAMVSCDEHEDYIAMMTVHDELVAETLIGIGTYQEFEGLLTDLPPEYDGCPIAAEGDLMTCYRK